MKKSILVLVTTLVVAMTVYAASSGPAGAAGTDTSCADGTPTTARNVPYVDDPVSPLQQLDVDGFEPTKGCGPAPVVIWVHGGGWRAGDKRNEPDKAELFNRLGYVFVSVNYRLSNPPGAASRPIHPAHAQDVGAAVAWVEEHIAEYGGDGHELAFLGHSAGGHLVSLVGTDPSYVEDAGGDAAALRCVISNDTEGYDLVERSASSEVGRRLVANAFGPDPAAYPGASPINHVGERDEPVDLLVITRGTPRRIAAALAFATAAEDAGSSVDVLEARGLTHRDVNHLLGTDGDTVITPAVTSFLERCLPVS
jgi:acetyl esterase/lipase